MQQGDLMGVLEPNGKIGCPILKVRRVTAEGFTMEWPNIGETDIYGNDGEWGKVGDNELEEAVGCGCFRCSSPLVNLALMAD